MITKPTKFATALAAAIAGLAFATTAAHAATINTMFDTGLNEIQDQSVERILRTVDGVTTVVTDGTFQEGDIIESILRFDSVNATTIGDVLPAPYQLTAYSQLQIGEILVIDDNGTEDPLDDTLRLIFEASGNLGANVLVEIYERTSVADPSIGSPGTSNFGVDPDSGISNVLNQILLAELGLNGIDDFWGSTTINDIGVLAAATSGSGQAAGGEFAISILSNPGNLPIAINGIMSPLTGTMHDVVGDASIYGAESGVNEGWLLSNNITASFNAVPEPGSLALLGMGLLGFAATSMRRRKS